jgi:signal transduction histidine kinase
LQEQVRLREIASHAKSEFLANMSHELRTPLNAVLGFSEIMLNEIFGPLGSDKYREYAQDIHMAGGHLLELINDVLDLTKVEAGQWTLNEEAVDLSQINRSMARMLRDQAGSKQIELSLNLPADGDATIFCDERAIKQVTLNLLTNAIKFTENGGRVDVTVEIASDRSAMIRISDTGIGISASDIPKALSAFGQAAATETRGHQGTGLGLPLAKNLTELHGGKLTLESEIGVGTTVIVHFPPERYLSNDD